MMTSSNDIFPETNGNAQNGMHTGARHTCHCGKAFIRKEHLRRHQANHGQHTHTCHVCQRAFSRSDLLRRHLSRHETAAVPSTRIVKACDACHVNKSKCSGISPCSLCIKKGISCSLNGTKEATSTKNITVAPHSPALTTSPDQISSDNSPRDMQEVSSTHISSIHTNFLRTLSIKPTLSRSVSQNEVVPYTIQEYHHEGDFPSHRGMIILYQSVKSQTIYHLEQIPNLPIEFETWVSACCRSYFNRFHLYWPVVHRPSFDQKQEPLIVSTTVVLIGAWLNKPEGAKPIILETHRLLMDQLFEQVCKYGESSQGQLWPVNLYSAILLNVIFALYTKDEHMISRARRLCSLFISILRELRMFSSNILSCQPRDHFPVTYPPHVQHAQERWKRIISCLFKADTYISLLCGQPPNIYWDELDVSLPQTFSQSNADGFDVYNKRIPYEPTDRPDYKSLALVSNSMQHAPSVLLIEDIQLGLCQLYQMVWRCSRPSHKEVIDICPTMNITESLISQLDSWKMKLDRVVILCTTQADQDSTELPLRAYFGFEEESKPGWKIPVLDRVKSLAQEGAMLYHLLSLQIHISKNSKLAELPLSNPTIGGIGNDMQMDWVSTWKQSKDARKALAHSVAITRTLELALFPRSSNNMFLPCPISSLAFSISRNLFRVWCGSPTGACTCNAEEPHTNLDLDALGLYRGPELQEWFENGGPPEVQGGPFCKCAGEMWFMRTELFV